MTIEATLEQIAREGTRVLVVGLGASAIECARSLISRGIQVGIIEKQPEVAFQKQGKYSASLNELGRLGVPVSFGVDGELVSEHLRSVGLVSLSPGVSTESAVVGAVKRLGVPLVAEFELSAALGDGQLVVVTGSNGKSTTAALLRHFLTTDTASMARERGDELPRGARVMEASSYQLEGCVSLKPAVSVILNINESHLERHGSIERYAAATSRVMKFQDARDYAVINADDPLAVGIAKSCQATLGVYGSRAPSELERLSRVWAHISGATSNRGAIEVSRNGALERYITDRCRLIGSHNRYNLAAAILIARRFGVSPSNIQEGIDSFSPLEHRLEDVGEIAGHSVINDSKSTTVAATLAGLQAVRERTPHSDVSLLIGGLSKAGSWGTLMSFIAKERGIKTRVVCFGEDGQLLASHARAQSLSPVVFATLAEATAFALQETQARGVVLLSPGCASFDEFTDYAHRGREFKRYAREFERGEERVTA